MAIVAVISAGFSPCCLCGRTRSPGRRGTAQLHPEAQPQHTKTLVVFLGRDVPHGRDLLLCCSRASSPTSHVSA